MTQSTEFDLSSDDLLDIEEVCAFFGGSRPLDASTIYRGAGTRYPKPVKVGPNTSRWLRSECVAALQKLIGERATPQGLIAEPAAPRRRSRGRPRKAAVSELQP